MKKNAFMHGICVDDNQLTCYCVIGVNDDGWAPGYCEDCEQDEEANDLQVG